MKVVKVQYTVKPSYAETNRRNIQKVMDDLRAEHHEPTAAERYRHLEPFLTGQHPSTSYKDVAEKLEMSESAVRVLVHRLRKRFGVLLRTEVAETVSDRAEVDEELRHLFSAIT